MEAAKGVIWDQGSVVMPDGTSARKYLIGLTLITDKEIPVAAWGSDHCQVGASENSNVSGELTRLLTRYRTPRRLGALGQAMAVVGSLCPEELLPDDGGGYK